MSIKMECEGRVAIVKVKGELTDDSLRALQEAVAQQHQETDVVDVILDMTESPFIDSSALEYLLDLKDSLVDKLGVVKLVGCDENVRTILRITRLADDFEQFDDVEAATETLNTPA